MKLLWIGVTGVMGALAIMTASAAPGDDKNPRFAPGPASSYSSKQTNDNVTVAAKAYDTGELAHAAFGKLNPYEHGILPILVIIQNDTDKAMRLDNLQVEYEALDGGRIEPTPLNEVRFVGRNPKPRPGVPSPIPGIHRTKKNPLEELAVVERAFVARMLPPHESALGFFYFQAMHRPGAKLYLTGITEAMTGKGLVYFEIPLEATLDR